MFARKITYLVPFSKRTTLIRSFSQKSSREDWCKLLGVSTNATQDDIKRVYQSQIKKWHPDLFATKSDQEQKLAHQKFQEIRQAYEELLKPPQLESNINNNNNNNNNNNTQNQTKTQHNNNQSKTTKTTSTKGQAGTFYTWSNLHHRAWNNSSDDDDSKDRQCKYSEPTFTSRLWYAFIISIGGMSEYCRKYNLVGCIVMTSVFLVYIYKAQYAKERVYGVAKNPLPANVVKHTDLDNINHNDFEQFCASVTSAQPQPPIFYNLLPYFKGERPYRDQFRSNKKHEPTNELSV